MSDITDLFVARIYSAHPWMKIVLRHTAMEDSIAWLKKFRPAKRHSTKKSILAFEFFKESSLMINFWAGVNFWSHWVGYTWRMILVDQSASPLSYCHPLTVGILSCWWRTHHFTNIHTTSSMTNASSFIKHASWNHVLIYGRPLNNVIISKFVKCEHFLTCIFCFNCMLLMD